MSYADGEALIETQIQNTSTFSSTTTSRGNWKLLSSGKAKEYAILRPGEFEREHYAMGGNYLTTWVTICEVWERYKNDETTLTDLQAAVADVVERFDAWRKAGDSTGNIVDVFVRRGGEPENMWRTNADGPSWMRQTLEIEWKEERSVTLQE